MDFSDALRMMRQGFRVRRGGKMFPWKPGEHIALDDDTIRDEKYEAYDTDTSDVLADDWEIVVYDTGLPQGVAKDLRMFPVDDWGDYQPGDCAQATDGKWSVVLRRDESTITVIRRPSMKAAQEYAKLVKEALKTPKVRRSELEDRRAKLEGELNAILVEIDSMGTVELNPTETMIEDPHAGCTCGVCDDEIGKGEGESSAIGSVHKHCGDSVDEMGNTIDDEDNDLCFSCSLEIIKGVNVDSKGHSYCAACYDKLSIDSTEVITKCKSCDKTNVILINGICMMCKGKHASPLDVPSPAIDFLCDCGHLKSKHCISGCMVTPDEDLSLVGKKDDHGDDPMFCLCLKKPDEIVETETLIVNVTVVTCENGSLPHTYGLGCANAVPVSIDNDDLSKEANA